jgi:hypothetical protein
MKTLKTLLLTLALCGCAGAQNYGAGCGALTTYTTALTIGQPFAVSVVKVSNTYTPDPAVLLVGFSAVSIPIGQFEQMPCTLYVAPAFTLTTTSMQGSAFFNFGRVPSDVRLVGLRLFFQGIVRSSVRPPPWDHEATDGLRMTVTQ